MSRRIVTLTMVPVSERLPEYREWYDVILRTDKLLKAFWGGVAWTDHDGLFRDVTHWAESVEIRDV